jgi:hypothetical protein
MRSLFLAGFAVLLGAGPALAEDPPKLPPDAHQLTGQEIVALYDGKTFNYKNFTFFGVVTGQVSYDFKDGTNHGTYQLGPRHGTFNGKIRIAKDRFCYTENGGEVCDLIYQAGSIVYEVKPSGIVQGINTRS